MLFTKCIKFLLSGIWWWNLYVYCWATDYICMPKHGFMPTSLNCSLNVKVKQCVMVISKLHASVYASFPLDWLAPFICYNLRNFSEDNVISYIPLTWPPNNQDSGASFHKFQFCWGFLFRSLTFEL